MDAQKLLQIRTLGQTEITLQDAVLPSLSAKSRAILIYLAITGGVSTRAELAGMFWPEMSEAAAKTNLRQALAKLRQALPHHLHIRRETVGIAVAAPILVDALRFATVAKQGLSAPQGDGEQLAAAAEFYAGDFLADVDANGFAGESLTEWLLDRRSHFRMLALQALHRLAVQAVQQRALALGLRYTDRLLALEPAHEEAHRQRMRLLAWDGQYDAALAQYEECRTALAAQLSVEPAPETGMLAMRIAAARTRPRHPPPHLLPADEPFIGRTVQLATLQRWLHAPESRLITIAGPGGAGKTRLALACAAQQQQLYLDGVFIAPLAEVSGSEQLAGAVAAALGLNLSGAQPVVDQVCAYLRRREILLLLDNVEQLLGDSGANSALAFLSRCLGAAPEVRMLVTSRERLNLAEERVLELDGLPYPATNGPINESREGADESHRREALAAPAVQLFLQSAARAGVATVDAERASEWTAILQICRLVQGLPLAIKLAAASKSGATYADRAARIAANLDALADANPAMPARQQSVRATLAYSWSLLTPAEQSLLAKAAIFQGGFDWAAGAAVVDATPELLAALIDKSLLRLDGQGRYAMHSLVAQFSAEQLSGRPAAAATAMRHQAIARRHAIYYLILAGKQRAALDGPAMIDAVTRLRAEEANLRRAWMWAVAHLGDEPAALEALASGRAGLEEFYFVTNQYVAGQTLVRAAIDALQKQVAAESSGSNGKTSPCAQELAAMLTSLARLLMIQRRYADAIRAARAGLQWAQRTDRADLTVRNRYCWGVTLYQQGHYLRARRQIDAGVDLAAQADLPRLLATGRHYQGNVAYHLGDYRTARQRIEEARVYFEALAPALPTQRSSILNNLGNVALQLGDYDQAGSFYRRALALRRSADGRQIGGTVTLYNLGRVHFFQHDYVAARAAYTEALDAYRRSDNRQGESMVLGALGEFYHQLGDFARAEDLYAQDLAMMEAIGQRARLGNVYSLLSRLRSDQGRAEQALALAEHAVEAARAQRQPHLLGPALIALGHARGVGAADANAAAAVAYRSAMHTLRRLGQTRLALEPLAGLAAVELAQGRPAQARRHVEVIVQHLQDDTLDGILTPMRIYLSCYAVFKENRDPRAQTILRNGYQSLQDDARRIDDEELRRKFLSDVPANRALVAAHQGALD